MHFDNLKDDILTQKLSNEQLFQKHFVDKETYFFSTGHVERNLEYTFKKDIAEVLEIHINDIYIVGSGKTGYSIKPKNEGGRFDRKFELKKLKRNKSDIDIAIVDTKLFDKVQENIYDWSRGFKITWVENIYYNEGKFPVPINYKFLEYLGKGWYRPDFAPTDFQIQTQKGELQNILNKWSQIFDRKIAFAIYKNWHFFKKYQLETIDLLEAKIKNGEL
ncbi:MAG: hypothetical protein WC691_05150 [Sulfuricurvum sp.]|jgi:hypothetical protein